MTLVSYRKIMMIRPLISLLWKEKRQQQKAVQLDALNVKGLFRENCNILEIIIAFARHQKTS